MRSRERSGPQRSRLRCNGLARESCTLQRATRITTGTGRCGCRPLMTWWRIGSAWRRPERFLWRIRGRRLKDETCRMFPRSKSRWRRRGDGSDSFSSERFTAFDGSREKSAGMSQWQAGPSVHYSEDFPDNIQSVTCTTPPVPRVKGIFGGRSHDGAALSGSKLPPEQPHTPCVRLAGDQNDGATLFLLESLANHAHFVSGVHNGRLQDVNCGGRDSFVNQDARAVNLLPFEGKSHGF